MIKYICLAFLCALVIIVAKVIIEEVFNYIYGVFIGLFKNNNKI